MTNLWKHQEMMWCDDSAYFLVTILKTGSWSDSRLKDFVPVDPEILPENSSFIIQAQKVLRNTVGNIPQAGPELLLATVSALQGALKSPKDSWMSWGPTGFGSSKPAWIEASPAEQWLHKCNGDAEGKMCDFTI